MDANHQDTANNNPNDVWKTVAEPLNAYKRELRAIEKELEKLVK